MYTTFESTIQAESAFQRERLAGLQSRPKRFRVRRRPGLVLPQSRRRPVVET